MINKKRQELIIQNLKSISSQVRAMSIEQLTNLPSLPAHEKIKLIEPCLQDSEDTVKAAAKIALKKLGGEGGSGSPAMPASSSTPSVSSSFSFNAPKPSNTSSSSTGGFELPSLLDIPSSDSSSEASPLGAPQGVGLSAGSKLGNSVSNKPDTLSQKAGSSFNLPNLFDKPVSKPQANTQPPSGTGFSLPGLNENPTPAVATPIPSAPMSTPVVPAPIPSAPMSTPVASAPIPSAPMSTPAASAPIPTAPVVAPTPKPMPSPAPVVAHAAPTASSGTVLIDGPVDASLPVIQNSTDIAFLLQHIREIASSKPSGYLTRLFELAKSVHEEVALTALQTLYNQKDDRVAPQIMLLLNNTSYSSQRRFLMLKIVMDTNVPLNADFLENILVNEKDVIIKSGLVKVFAKNCNQDGVPLLIRCLKDEDPRVRANTVEVIESQNISGCEKEIVKMLDDSENRVKVNAAKYLVKIGYQQAFLTLRNMLGSPEVWLRDSVIFALGEIGDQSSLVLLRAALKDPNQGIRLSVLKSLAKINTAMARQILKAATNDPDQVVAQVAISLFERIKDTPVREESVPGKTPQNRPAPAQTPQMGRATSSLHSSGNAPSPSPSASPLPSMPSLGSVPKPMVNSASGIAGHPRPSAPVGMPRPHLTNTPSASVGISRPKTANPPTAPSLPAGSPTFSKPRSAAIYAKLCSPSVDEQRSGMKDVAFVMGQDQMILIEKAISLEDESIRIAAVKILSRRRTPDVKEILSRLTGDSNDTIASMAKKSLMLMK